MKILMLNTFDEGGGAARAATRLLTGVRGLGIDADLLVQFKFGSASNVICNKSHLRNMTRRLKLFLGLLPVRIYPKRPELNFSPALIPDKLPAEISEINPDIIHLHWLGAGFLSVETLGRLDMPLVWTLHDSWPFTGGCHVPYDCVRYRRRCGACPVLGSAREKDLSRWTWNRKQKAWRDLNLTLVAPSRWLADCARSSSLFRDVRVEVIPNGLDTGMFQPGNKAECRDLLGLTKDKRIILFGAVQGTIDPNKGFHLLKPALQALGKDSSDMLALVFGDSSSVEMPDLGMPVISRGIVHDDRTLAAIYSAADVFVAPSMLENLPNTVMEAMACGTPCVAFRQGGVPELVDHEMTGYLAQPYDADDLARGIAWVLEDRGRREELSIRARRKVESQFQQEQVAQQYLNLYAEILSAKEPKNG
jgi:glycosyltransferase involved in cell wall biosynthesis